MKRKVTEHLVKEFLVVRSSFLKKMIRLLPWSAPPVPLGTEQVSRPDHAGLLCPGETGISTNTEGKDFQRVVQIDPIGPTTQHTVVII